MRQALRCPMCRVLWYDLWPSMSRVAFYQRASQECLYTTTGSSPTNAGKVRMETLSGPLESCTKEASQKSGSRYKYSSGIARLPARFPAEQC